MTIHSRRKYCNHNPTRVQVDFGNEGILVQIIKFAMTTMEKNKGKIIFFRPLAIGVQTLCNLYYQFGDISPSITTYLQIAPDIKIFVILDRKAYM